MLLLHHANIDSDEERMVVAMAHGTREFAELGKALKRVCPDGKRPKGRHRSGPAKKRSFKKRMGAVAIEYDSEDEPEED
eukprot:6635207-Alexandrium_andersonii.AAC.1